MMKERKSFWLIGVVLLCAVVFMIAMISTKRSLSDWGKISSIEYCENILDEKISEIRIRKFGEQMDGIFEYHRSTASG